MTRYFFLATSFLFFLSTTAKAETELNMNETISDSYSPYSYAANCSYLYDPGCGGRIYNPYSYYPYSYVYGDYGFNYYGNDYGYGYGDDYGYNRGHWNRRGNRHHRGDRDHIRNNSRSSSGWSNLRKR